jgi:hypothetical protein
MVQTRLQVVEKKKQPKERKNNKREEKEETQYCGGQRDRERDIYSIAGSPWVLSLHGLSTNHISPWGGGGGYIHIWHRPSGNSGGGGLPPGLFKPNSRQAEPAGGLYACPPPRRWERGGSVTIRRCEYEAIWQVAGSWRFGWGGGDRLMYRLVKKGIGSFWYVGK